MVKAVARELEAFGEPERDLDYADHGRLLAAELDKGYRGLPRVTIQVLLTLIVANAKRMARRLQAHPAPGSA